MDDKILLYSQLPPAEQAEVEAYVRRHPDLAPLLEEARAWGALFQDVHASLSDTPGDEAVAYYVATRALGETPPPAVQRLFAHMEARLEADAVLRARYDRFVRRVEDLERGHDAAATFERLTGRVLRAPVPHAPAEPAARRQPPFILRALRGTAWAAAACTVLYLLLFGVSVFSQDRLDRLAAFEPSELRAPVVRMRGAPVPEAGSPDAHYAEALAWLRASHSSTLGLFPRYNRARLVTAETLLEQVVDATPEATPLREEALYRLAKTRLLLRDRPGAEAALGEVSASGGRHAAAADGLLQRLSDF